MPNATPFDSTVTVTWNIEQPINAILELHTGLSQIDRALDNSKESANAWSMRFYERIQLVHSGFLQVITDIGEMQNAMDKTAMQAAGGPTAMLGNLQASGQIGGYSNQRLPDQPGGTPPPPAGWTGTAEQWRWGYNAIQQGQDQGLSPTVMATAGIRNQLISATGGFSLASTGNGYNSPFNTSGFTGDALAGLLQANLGQAQGMATQALTDMKVGKPGAEQDYKDAIDAAAGYRKELEAMAAAGKNTTSSFDQMGASILRHVGIMVQAVVIWGSLRAAQDFLKQMVADVQQLESTSARLAFINPGGSAGAQYAQAARFGVGMTDAAGGILSGGQGGATAGQRNQAGQLAEIFGANQYSQAMLELIQTEKRASDAGLEHVNVMGYMATAYQSAPTDMKANFDALQLGITMYKELGLTAEQTGLMLLKTATALGQSPEVVSNVLERIYMRLGNPKVQQDLAAQYGIKGVDQTDLLKQVSARVATDPTGSQNLMNFLTQGLGIQGPKTLLDMTTALVEFNKAATQSNQPLANINTVLGNIDQTGPQAFAHLKGSVDAYLASLISAESHQTNFQQHIDALNLSNPSKALGAWYQMLIGAENGVSSMFSTQSNVNAYQTATGKSPYATVEPTKPEGIVGAVQSAIGGWLGGLLGPALAGPMGLLNFASAGKDQSQYTPEYLAWLNQQNGTGAGGPGALDPRGPDRSMLKGLPSPSLTQGSPFGGFQDLPKNFDWDKFQSDLKKYSAQLSKDVPDYVQNPQEVAFWDASKGYYRTANADSQVIQRAMQDQANALKQITGVFNVPSTGEVLVPFFALQSGMAPSTDPRLRNQAGHNGLGPRPGTGAGGHETGGMTAGIDPNYIPGGLDAGQLGVMGYLRAHGYSPSAAGGLQSGRTASGSLLDPRSEAIAQHRDAMAPTIQISLRNVVMLNSRVIYDEMQHQMQAQMSQARRGVGGGAGSSYTIG